MWFYLDTIENGPQDVWNYELFFVNYYKFYTYRIYLNMRPTSQSQESVFIHISQGVMSLKYFIA